MDKPQKNKTEESSKFKSFLLKRGVHFVAQVMFNGQ